MSVALSADGGTGLSAGAAEPGNPQLWVWNLRDNTMVRCFSNLTTLAQLRQPCMTEIDLQFR